MDELIGLLYYHARRGELARCKMLVTSKVAETLSMDTENFIGSIIEISLGNSEPLQDHKTAQSLQAVKALAELLNAESEPIKDQDRITILRSEYDIELATLPEAAYSLLYFVCGCFGVIPQDYIKFDVTGPVKAVDEFVKGDLVEIKKYSLLSAACIDQLNIKEIDSLYDYLEKTKTSTVKSQIEHLFKNRINILVGFLATANFSSNSDMISTVSASLQDYVKQYIGRPIEKHQIITLQEAVLGIARAYPSSEILLFLADFLNENYSKINEFILLQGYLLAFASYFKQSKEIAEQAIKKYEQAPEAVLFDDTMLMPPESAYSLALAVAGRLEEAKEQTSDDDEAEEIVKLILRSFSEDCHKDFIEYAGEHIKDVVFDNRHDLYSGIVDTLPSVIIATKIVEYLHQGPIYDTMALQNAYDYFENITQECFEPQLLLCKFMLLNNLQNFDFMLRQANELSAYAATENNFALNSQILLLFAGSAAQLQKITEAAEFTSQAELIDSQVQNELEFKMIQAKIAFMKGEYLKSASFYESLEQDVPVKIHVALLKVKGGDTAGYIDLKNLQMDYPVKSGLIEIEYDMKSKDFLAMHIALSLATAGLYLLREAGYLATAEAQNIGKNSFEMLIDENSLLFFENTQILDQFREAIENSFSNTTGNVGSKYISAKYGASPINLEKDVFYCQQQGENTKIQEFCRSNRITVIQIVEQIQNYSLFSLEITELLSQIHLVLLNDKLGYVNCFSQLIRQTPSTTKLAALASAHLAVGNAQQAQEYYQKSIEEAKNIIQQSKLPHFIEILIVNFLIILKSRALSRCHRYADCNAILEDLCNNMQFEKVQDKQLEQATLIIYSMVHIENMRLLIKLHKNRQLYELCDNIIRKAESIFGLPNDTTKSFSAPIPVTFLSIYCLRAKAELIKLNQVNLPKTERLDLLQKATFYVDTGILSKTERVLLQEKDFTMQMAQSVFSRQQSKFKGQNDGLKALVLAAEIRVEMAEVYFDLSEIDYHRLNESNNALQFDKKQHLQNAFDAAKISIKHCATARACNISAVYHLIVTEDCEEARKYAVLARQIEPFNGTSELLLQQISHKMNFGNAEEDAESSKANTPFEDSCKVLKTGLNVDRQAALDNFLLNSCLVHDLIVVTDSLFSKGGDDFEEHIENIGTDAISLDEMNQKQETAIKTSLDGYFYLGRGFLELKMGRVEDSMKDLMNAVNSQTLSDRYRVRALYLLGTVYVNPTREPLFGATSCLTGKEQSAVALQKAALQQNQVNEDNLAVGNELDGTGEENYVPDTQTINQRDQDLAEALQIVQKLQNMYQRQVQEARELFIALKAYIRIGQYKLSLDRISRTMLDEGKTGKAKIQQLETLRDQAKAYMMEAAEELHQVLQEIDKNECNYVVLLYCLGNVYCHLKNEAKARSNFQNGARQITNIREQANQSTIWLDIDAAVQCNLALADQYVQIGKLTNAIKCLDGVASLDKIQTISYELYGLCQEKEAAFGDAVQYYESAWLLSHGSPSVAYRLAFNYMKSHKYGEAILMCQNALSEYPGFQKLKKEVLFKAEQMMRSQSVGEQ